MVRLLLLFILVSVSLRAQEDSDPKATWKREYNKDGRWNDMDVGPTLASVLRTPGGVISKGLTIRLGTQDEICVAYDLQSMSMRCAWKKGFLSFNPEKFGMVRAPVIAGDVFLVCSRPAWGKAKVRFTGMGRLGSSVSLEYTVDGVGVVERPVLLEEHLVREITLQPHHKTLSLLLSDQPAYGEKKRPEVVFTGHDAVQLRQSSDVAELTFSPSRRPVTVRFAYREKGDGFELKKHSRLPENKPPHTLWPEIIETTGILGQDDQAYTLDTIGVPFENPWKALMFISGHDFFAGGDIAVCTLYGDVWVVSGVDEELKKIRWKRFATGLHQPLGLRIVKDVIYVLGRDQITRLHDRNQDGEADFFENFNNDGQTSTSGHDYAACLETDAKGNFYYIRAHEGIIRVSPDGKTHQSIAEGFRNPIGLGVGRNGVITAAAQEGQWTPASAITEVKAGGYYGFPGPRITRDRPLGYDLPLCWMPRAQDTSSGGQVWVEHDRWGPLQGRLLHFSYGQCRMLLVMREQLGGTAQGGTVRFPIRFQSGAMRGRFSPVDHQLYVSGLRGWQTAGVKDGCLQRVRYTGKPLLMAVNLEVGKNGVRITFSDPLERERAAKAGSYSIERWNYLWSRQYGSKDYKLSDGKLGRDKVAVKSATVSKDGRSVFLELEDMKPCMQMRIRYRLRSADGARISQEIYNTIHVLPE
ncbi:MAG: hypothetical protein NZ935_14410 [Planctomycetes bacterium]|jgi:hypothetical protein|nr:hypothetical protein [Planctomycetota bacterium]